MQAMISRGNTEQSCKHGWKHNKAGDKNRVQEEYTHIKTNQLAMFQYLAQVTGYCFRITMHADSFGRRYNKYNQQQTKHAAISDER